MAEIEHEAVVRGSVCPCPDSNALGVRYKKIICSAKTTTDVWSVAIAAVSGFSTFKPGHTGERRVRQELAEKGLFCHNITTSPRKVFTTGRRRPLLEVDSTIMSGKVATQR